MNNLEDANKIEIEDSAESNEMWDDLERYKDADGAYDLTGMNDERVIKIIKSMKPDNIKVVRNSSNIIKVVELERGSRDINNYRTYVNSNGIILMIPDCISYMKGETLILMEKKELYNFIQEGNYIKTDLPKNTKVMARDDDDSFWALLLYNGNSECYTSSKSRGRYEHVIPCSIFDFNDTEKWNGTENDYGMRSGAIIVTTVN